MMKRTKRYESIAAATDSGNLIDKSLSLHLALALRYLITSGIVVTLLFPIMLGVSFAQQTLSQSAILQIQALLDEKASWTPAQQKIDCHLIHAIKMDRGEAFANRIQTLRQGVDIDPDRKTLVDIKANVTEALLQKIQSAGGEIINSFPQYNAIRARIPLTLIESMAALPDIKNIRPADKAITNSHNPAAVNVTEGDVAHRAGLARSTFGFDGTGIKVGVLSDSVDFLAGVQATGDLPAVTVLPGQSGVPSTGEGTAMLEIVHDLAPGADLFFATAFSGQAQFAANILALRAAGCDVIVDDVFYVAEPVFQDGIIAQAVNMVSADGACYFSSAGNSGNLNDGESGVWEGDFVPAPIPPPISLAGMDAHDFGGGANSNQITSDPPFVITLHWSDPVGGSTNDYDLFLLDPGLAIVFDFSTNSQTGTQDPFELIDSALFDDTNNRLVIVRFSGDPRFLHMNTIRGRLAIATDGQTSGHAAAQDAFGVAAVNVATAGGLPFTGGAANPVEIFSSDGPRRVFYKADGTPITPGNFLSTGGEVRQKPDLAAADGVSTATPGFGTFFGTSASAPHAAGIAALIKSAKPGITLSQVRTVITSTALDIEAPGVDRDSGFGIVDAFDAVSQAAAMPPTVVELVSFKTTTYENSVTLEWKTATEIDNAGFNIWRSEAGTGKFTKINEFLIPAQGGATWGAEYSFTDSDVVPGRTYYYQLEDVEFDGDSALHGPVSVRMKDDRRSLRDMIRNKE